MASSTVHQQPQALHLDPFFAYRQAGSTQTSADFSSPSLYSPVEDFGTDFTTDSASSPDSPLSPLFPGSFSFPQQPGGWLAWDGKTERSPAPEAAKTLFLSASNSAVNPMDLAGSGADDVVLGMEGIDDIQPLFQSIPPQSHPGSFFPSFSPPSPLIKTSPPASPLLAAQQLEAAPPSTSKGPQRPSPQRRNHLGQSTQSSSSGSKSKRYPTRNLKRKSPSASTSGEDDDNEDDGGAAAMSYRSSASPPPAARRASSGKDAASAGAGAGAGGVGVPKKTAHNMIEKRYRTNLNDKIAALRDAVPALRVVSRKSSGAGHERQGGEEPDAEGEDDLVEPGALQQQQQQQQRRRRSTAGTEDLGGLAPAHKLNKATILSKATEYITHLERRNQNLAKENAMLRTRVEGLEMLVMGGGGGTTGVWN